MNGDDSTALGRPERDEAKRSPAGRTRRSRTAPPMQGGEGRGAFLPAGQRGGGLEPGEPVHGDGPSGTGQVVGTPLRKVDSLKVMHMRGTISDAMLAAGRRFQRAFEDYHAGNCSALDWRKIGRAGWKEPEFLRSGRWRELKEAMTVLGGRGAPAGSVCWHVLGEGVSIKEWAELHQWGRRPLHEKTASGVLLGALGVLAVLWKAEA
jgi:hypothetical protein